LPNDDAVADGIARHPRVRLVILGRGIDTEFTANRNDRRGGAALQRFNPQSFRSMTVHNSSPFHETNSFTAATLRAQINCKNRTLNCRKSPLSIWPLLSKSKALFAPKNANRNARKSVPLTVPSPLLSPKRRNRPLAGVPMSV